METAIVGFGQRGHIYADQFYKAGWEIKAVCDPNPYKREQAAREYGVDRRFLFADAKEFFAAGKIADVLVVASLDKDHYFHATEGLKAGYDILLEKPISPSERECVDLAAEAARLKRKVVVAHVLRYTPFYRKLKEIVAGGAVGGVVGLAQRENIGYWHFAHSYVRGNWRRSEEAAPIILAKCCHDTDIIRWIVGKPCKAVSSFGKLNYFKRENAPPDSAGRCVDCRIPCPYNALEFYSKPGWEGWFALISKGETDIAKCLKSSPYGRCVYKCDNDVADTQCVQMLFEGGVSAQLLMTAFSRTIYRAVHIYGDKGAVEGNLEDGRIRLGIFGRQDETIDLKESAGDVSSGHAGGDARLVWDLIAALTGESPFGITDIGVSVESHRICFAAERSRLNGGKLEAL
ncbi:MAG: Gfo/Idh/MocA family oxidoreductase [Clostridiales bacterium]|jgi:predicted dehydrogenase|nr:Gfo/Idh/MocA family oxidoreductase [Clostridiales bacterium]